MRRRFVVLAGVLAGVLTLGARSPVSFAAEGAAAMVEHEFEAAIRTVTPATVYCVAKPGLGPGSGSSGVIITKTGYVLSDGDAGVYFRPVKGPDGKPVAEKAYSDEVEIRIPDLKKGSYQVYPAKVVRRVAAIDSTLLKITAPPASGFPFVAPRTSSDLAVGQFTFAMGMSFGQEAGAAALTGGIVAALVPAPKDQPGGPWSEVHTSAAVNPGVNGGPLVDVEGGLVGVISTWGAPEKDNPFQFLGKAYPIDRIRHAYRDVPEAAAIFPDPKTLPARSKQSALLETAFESAAKAAYPSVVSLEIARPEAFVMRVPQLKEGGMKRYEGPVSGVVASADGWIVSSLYDFANTAPLAYFGYPNEIAATLGRITSVTAHFPDGTSVPARIVAHDQRLGVVCLKAELPAGYVAKTLTVAPAESHQQGRMVLCVGNPFGAARFPAPLLTVGMYSRLHRPDDEKAWRGDFQTDAGMTDGNCGGALVDVHGRLLGLATLWDPAGQGRASGIGFGIPWDRIVAALPVLEAGISLSYGNGWLGIGWGQATDGIRITLLQKDGPAAKAGLAIGDLVKSVDGSVVARLFDAQELVRVHNAGDKVTFVVDRGGESKEIVIELAKRPGW